MKKVLFLLSFLCLYVAGSHAAATARIMAYDLRLTTEGENYTFTFKANEAPTEAALVFYSVGTGKIIGEKPLAGIVKGANSVTLSRNQLPGGGTMNWGVKLHAGAIASIAELTDNSTHKYEFYLPQGIAVNNCTESDYFGHMYITEIDGASDGMSDRTDTQKGGIFEYDLALNEVNPENEGWLPGGITAGSDRQEMKRITVDPQDGMIYFNRTTKIYKINPTDMTAATDILDGKVGITKVNACYAESGVVYFIDNANTSTGGTLKKITSDGTISNVLTSKLWGVQDLGFCSDGRGGFWVAQHRSTPSNDAFSALTHVTSAGTIDYSVNKNSSSTILSLFPTANGNAAFRGQVAYYAKENLLAFGGNYMATIFKVTYGANGVPTLERWKQTAKLGQNIDGLSFDYAGNLYVTCASKERMYAFTVPTDDNTCTVPAKKSLTVYKPLAGTYKIGGDDAEYTSFYDATKDINKCGISADVNLLICDNLVETKNPCLTNPTDYTITIRPDQDAARKISFTQTADNDGPSGGFVIGGVEKENTMIGWATTLTNNIIIDGFADGYETRRLTFDAPSGHNYLYPILFYGDVRNSQIKNCIVSCTKGAGTRAGITIRTAKETNTAPQNILIENNIINPGSNAGQGIMFNGSQATTKGVGAPKDCIIRNNRIEVQNKGIYLNGANGLTIENNEFHIAGANGMNSHAIMGDQYNKGDIIIRNNKFNLTTNNAYDNDYGVIGVASSGLAAGQTIQWTIENNYFGGLDAKNASASSKKFKMMYIRCANPTIVRHNTFHIPAFTKSVGMDLVSAYCASAVYFASSSEYIVQNNIFVCEETNSKVSLIRGALNTNIRNNIFYHAGGNGAIVAGTDVYNTYIDLPEAYRTTYNNKNVPVEFSDGYHFTDEYANNINLGVEHLDGFNYDIEGNTRNFPTRAGCYDPAWQVTLDQASTSNSDLLEAFNDVLVDASINRSFGNDGWYTLVLPFDATVEQLTEVFGEGYKVAVLKDSRWKSETDMYLNFEQQSTIEAGVPCLIKPATSTGSEIVFHNVTIDKDLQSIETDVVDMIGLYNQTTVTLDADNYYLGNGNLLYEYNTEYASSYALTNGFRAYFHFNFPLPAGCSARVIFREDTATEIEDLQEATTPVVKKVLRDEQLIIIRDGKEYNVQGQLVR